MSREIYDLLKDHRNLDDDFINIAFELFMLEDRSLEDYIRDFKIVDVNSRNLGTYSNEDREICVNKNNILHDKSIKNKKLLALETIRHEIEHARNLKRLYECRNDIESMIVKFSLLDYAIDHGLARVSSFDQVDPFTMAMRKADNYEIDPGERLVEIKAWKYMVNLLKNQRTSEDLLIARSMLFYSYIRGYKNNGYYLDPPTYQYLLNTGLYHEFYIFKKTVERTGYSLDTRLNCGLPITEGEYDKGVLRKVLLQKRKTN